MAEVLAKSTNDYGQRHATHYEALILVAIADVTADYKRLGARRVPRLPDVWVYELWHSRNHVPGGMRTVTCCFCSTRGHSLGGSPAMRVVDERDNIDTVMNLPRNRIGRI
jgi:hypothetical protein